MSDPFPNPMRAGLGSLRRFFQPVLLLPALLMLGGCDMVVMDPAGDVALQQRNLILISTALMLLIIVPVMALTTLFAWRYRHSNEAATYDPDFDHSTQLELVIWAAPLLIIICLGALTWTSTHLLDPYRPVGRLAADRPVEQGVRPLEVQVVALDWKWLFIYPELGIATVNEFATPVNRPIRFRITGSTVMNSFYIPALAGQIYAMPGMETPMNAVLNRRGEYEGFSAMYSGAGFSDMRFRVHGLDDAGFDRWVRQVRQSQGALGRAAYVRLERPSEKVPAMRFARVEPGLFDRVVNRCVAANTPCMSDQMRHDRADGGDPHQMRPGAGTPPVNNTGTMHGQKATGALFKAPEEKGSSPNLTKQRRPGAPGNTDPGAARNRDLSSLLRAPGIAGAASV